MRLILDRPNFDLEWDGGLCGFLSTRRYDTFVHKFSEAEYQAAGRWFTVTRESWATTVSLGRHCVEISRKPQTETAVAITRDT